MQPPHIQFQTRIYHPNVDAVGRICLDVIKSAPDGSWSPTKNLKGALIAIRMLMSDPNPDDPLDVDIAAEYKQNSVLFDFKAREMTAKFAIAEQTVTEVENVVPEAPIEKELMPQDALPVVLKVAQEQVEAVAPPKRKLFNLSSKSKRVKPE